MEQSMIAEPMTVLTDFLLAGFAGWIAWRLRQPGGARMRSRRLWGWGIAVQGAGALAGGIYHGLAPWLEFSVAGVLWLITVWFHGAATSLLLAGVGYAVFRKNVARVLAIAMGVKFIFFAIWCIPSSSYLPALTDQLVSTAILVFLLIIGRKWLGRSAQWIVRGLAILMIGAIVQFFGLAPHPQFNHNDLYHVFALISLGCFYRGGRELQDRPA